ncbi:hypothetical protein Agabi119p4_2562 [Agaricus bisporus var. burnettii]|uniref:F-box domain-containing protein n=1 Tax=Agaricus bisporus var. burnettii TaxID=192524 RepID=A0A8H7F996_AGABI|nr:hypothetical protein Agabi119p4_2562 [Agaricus bisporus var. burnettii]
MPCPYCLHTTPGTLSAFTPEKDIDAEIEHIEDLISSLIAARTRLRKKRNELRCPIYSLPPEIVALIFKFTCPSLNFSRRYGIDAVVPSQIFLGLGESDKVIYPRTLGVLSTVSVLWHSVVSSTPSLWTSFVANDMDLHLMQTVLARSGNLPISASITTPDVVTPHLSTVLNPNLLDHAARIRMLHVRYASSTWLKAHIASFIHLELLSLQGNVNREELVLVGSSCTRLVLKNFVCRIFLSWSKIQVLHLTLIPVGVCLEMLQRCTNLIEFKVQRSHTSSVVDGVQLPSSSFILPRLEVFEWLVNGENSADCLMLQYTYMPVLKTLIWSESHSNLPPSGALATFFKRLPSTLSTVEMQSCTHHSGIFSYFWKFPHVEDLVFRDCAGSFMDGVFSSLGAVVENQEMPTLPKLKSIYIGNSPFRLDQENVLQTFRRRCSWPSGSSREINTFRLEFTKPQVDWTPEFHEELIEMVEEGYKVELWEDSKPVDWLSM